MRAFSYHVRVVLFVALCACAGPSRPDVLAPAPLEEPCGGLSHTAEPGKSRVATRSGVASPTPSVLTPQTSNVHTNPPGQGPATAANTTGGAIAPCPSSNTPSQPVASRPPVAVDPAQVPAPAAETPVASSAVSNKKRVAPQFHDWYCFEHWQDGRRGFPFKTVCKRTKELCELAQSSIREPGRSMSPCSFKDKAFCVRMRIYALEAEYLDCSETWYQCMTVKTKEFDEPQNYQSLSDCDERD